MSTITATPIIDALQWRYATKRFDNSKTVSAEDIETLKTAVNLTATSFGLQPFRLLVIDDADLKQQLREASYDQPQLTESSHVFVLAAKTDMSPEYIEDFIKRLAEGRGMQYSDLEGYAGYIKGSVASKDAEFVEAWNKRQAYIALGSLLAAAGELQIDACPMEGFEAAKYDELLGLTKRGLTATVIAPVGYRSEEDKTAGAAKVRLPLEDLVIQPM